MAQHLGGRYTHCLLLAGRDLSKRTSVQKMLKGSLAPPHDAFSWGEVRLKKPHLARAGELADEADGAVPYRVEVARDGSESYHYQFLVAERKIPKIGKVILCLFPFRAVGRQVLGAIQDTLPFVKIDVPRLVSAFDRDRAQDARFVVKDLRLNVNDDPDVDYVEVGGPNTLGSAFYRKMKDIHKGAALPDALRVEYNSQILPAPLIRIRLDDVGNFLFYLKSDASSLDRFISFIEAIASFEVFSLGLGNPLTREDLRART